MLPRSTGNRAARRQRHALRALGAELHVNALQRLFLEEHIARVAPQHLLHALWIAGNPRADAGPAGVGNQVAVQQPAAHALVGLVVGARIGQANQAHAAIGLGNAQAARALDVQHQGFNRITQPRNLTPSQGGLRLGKVSICWRVYHGFFTPKPAGSLYSGMLNASVRTREPTISGS